MSQQNSGDTDIGEAESTTDAEYTPPRVEVYVTGEPVDVAWCRQTLERLESCIEAGAISDLSVHVWPRTVCHSLDIPGSPIERVEAFEDWAHTNGRSLEPAFETYTTTSTVLDQEREVCRLPVLCVACYVDEELVHVAPCSTDEGTITVEQTLAALETTVVNRPVEPERNDTAPETDTQASPR